MHIRLILEVCLDRMLDLGMRWCDLQVFCSVFLQLHRTVSMIMFLAHDRGGD